MCMIISIHIRGDGMVIAFKGELTINSEKNIISHVCGIKFRNIRRRIKTIMEEFVKGIYNVTVKTYKKSDTRVVCKFRYENVPKRIYTNNILWNYKEDIMYEMIQILEENSYILISSHHDVFNSNLSWLSKTIMTFRNMRFVS